MQQVYSKNNILDEIMLHFTDNQELSLQSVSEKQIHYRNIKLLSFQTSLPFVYDNILHQR